jgi:hypothetical protein
MWTRGVENFLFLHSFCQIYVILYSSLLGSLHLKRFPEKPTDGLPAVIRQVYFNMASCLKTLTAKMTEVSMLSRSTNGNVIDSTVIINSPPAIQAVTIINIPVRITLPLSITSLIKFQPHTRL